MRTFRYQSPQGEKVWKILRQGTSLQISVAEPGMEETVHCQEFKDEKLAKLEESRLVRSILARGYVEIIPGQIQLAHPLAIALENALLNNPDDLAAHSAYADWLSEQEDPLLAARGEFIAVQLALEDQNRPNEETHRLRRREQELLEQYQQIWVGGLAPFLGDKEETGRCFGTVQVEFARGWIDHLTLLKFDECLAGVVTQIPELKLLRHLSLHGQEETEFLDWSDCVTTLARWLDLRHICIFDIVNFIAIDLRDLIAKLPRLIEFNLTLTKEPWVFRHPGPWDALELDFSGLRSLAYRGTQAFPFEQLAENRTLANLQRLGIHQLGVSQPFDPSGLRDLVRAPHLAGLKHLAITLDLTDEGYQVICTSPLVDYLDCLELGPLGAGESIAYLINRFPQMKAFRRVASGRWERTNKRV